MNNLWNFRIEGFVYFAISLHLCQVFHLGLHLFFESWTGSLSFNILFPLLSVFPHPLPYLPCLRHYMEKWWLKMLQFPIWTWTLIIFCLRPLKKEWARPHFRAFLQIVSKRGEGCASLSVCMYMCLPACLSVYWKFWAILGAGYVSFWCLLQYILPSNYKKIHCLFCNEWAHL